MNQDQLIILLFKIVLVAGEAGAVGFAAVYTRLAPWWRNPLGRTIVYLDLLLAVALLVSILSLFFRFNRLTSHIAAWVDLAVFAAIAVTLLARIPLWIRLHHADKATADTEPGS